MICSLEGHVEQCTEYVVRNDSMIHGDLGVWNMLFMKQKTLLIDFGEVRRGDPHLMWLAGVDQGEGSYLPDGASTWSKACEELPYSKRYYFSIK